MRHDWIDVAVAVAFAISCGVTMTWAVGNALAHEPGDSDDPCEHGCSHRVRRCRKGCEVEPEKERDQCLLGCEFEHQECVEGCRK